MGSLAEIRQKLLAGELPVDLIKAGYKKSTVYHEFKKLRSLCRLRPLYWLRLRMMSWPTCVG